MNRRNGTARGPLALGVLMLALLAAQPASAQVQVLAVDTNVPLAATLDNPCTTPVEAIAFTGAVRLVQEVWLMPTGNLRLIVQEQTTLQGEDAAVFPGSTSPKYGTSASSKTDVEFTAGAASLMSFKKVINNVQDDNFHAVLVMNFDPQTFKLELKLEGACENGEPTP